MWWRSGTVSRHLRPTKSSRSMAKIAHVRKSHRTNSGAVRVVSVASSQLACLHPHLEQTRPWKKRGPCGNRYQFPSARFVRRKGARPITTSLGGSLLRRSRHNHRAGSTFDDGDGTFEVSFHDEIVEMNVSMMRFAEEAHDIGIGSALVSHDLVDVVRIAGLGWSVTSWIRSVSEFPPSKATHPPSVGRACRRCDRQRDNCVQHRGSRR